MCYDIRGIVEAGSGDRLAVDSYPGIAEASSLVFSYSSRSEQQVGNRNDFLLV